VTSIFLMKYHCFLLFFSWYLTKLFRAQLDGINRSLMQLVAKIKTKPSRNDPALNRLISKLWCLHLMYTRQILIMNRELLSQMTLVFVLTMLPMNVIFLTSPIRNPEMAPVEKFICEWVAG